MIIMCGAEYVVIYVMVISLLFCPTAIPSHHHDSAFACLSMGLPRSDPVTPCSMYGSKGSLGLHSF